MLSVVMVRVVLLPLVRRCVNRSGLLVGWILLIGPPRRLLVLSREEPGVVPAEVVLALWDAVSKSSVDDFWSGLFGA